MSTSLTKSAAAIAFGVSAIAITTQASASEKMESPTLTLLSSQSYAAANIQPMRLQISKETLHRLTNDVRVKQWAREEAKPVPTVRGNDEQPKAKEFLEVAPATIDTTTDNTNVQVSNQPVDDGSRDIKCSVRADENYTKPGTGDERGDVKSQVAGCWVEVSSLDQNGVRVTKQVYGDLHAGFNTKPIDANETMKSRIDTVDAGVRVGVGTTKEYANGVKTFKGLFGEVNIVNAPWLIKLSDKFHTWVHNEFFGVPGNRTSPPTTGATINPAITVVQGIEKPLISTQLGDISAAAHMKGKISPIDNMLDVGGSIVWRPQDSKYTGPYIPESARMPIMPNDGSFVAATAGALVEKGVYRGGPSQDLHADAYVGAAIGIDKKFKKDFGYVSGYGFEMTYRNFFTNKQRSDEYSIKVTFGFSTAPYNKDKAREAELSRANGAKVGETPFMGKCKFAQGLPGVIVCAR